MRCSAGAFREALPHNASRGRLARHGANSPRAARRASAADWRTLRTHQEHERDRSEQRQQGGERARAPFASSEGGRSRTTRRPASPESCSSCRRTPADAAVASGAGAGRSRATRRSPGRTASPNGRRRYGGGSAKARRRRGSRDSPGITPTMVSASARVSAARPRATKRSASDRDGGQSPRQARGVHVAPAPGLAPTSG